MRRSPRLRTVGLDGHDGGEGAERAGEPLLLVGEGAGHQVEGGGGVLDLVVVDVADLLGVGDGGQPDEVVALGEGSWLGPKAPIQLRCVARTTAMLASRFVGIF